MLVNKLLSQRSSRDNYSNCSIILINLFFFNIPPEYLIWLLAFLSRAAQPRRGKFAAIIQTSRAYRGVESHYHNFIFTAVSAWPLHISRALAASVLAVYGEFNLIKSGARPLTFAGSTAPLRCYWFGTVFTRSDVCVLVRCLFCIPPEPHGIISNTN